MELSVKLNNTSRPVEYKTWLMTSGSITTNQAETLHSVGIRPNVNVDIESVDLYNGSYKMPKAWRITFDTTTPEQEATLKLMYGERLMLLMVEVVLANSFSTCTLERL